MREPRITEPLADNIAKLFNNDGQMWTRQGLHLTDICKTNAVLSEEDGDLRRYEFYDGSAIVTADGGWKIEGAEPYSSAGPQ